jgi:hypothetical protein
MPSLSRREFIRLVGGTTVLSAYAPHYAHCADALSTCGVLVEAASFAKRGGWVLDTQFYQQVGGCYLLAHGLGQALADASTDFQLPSAGTWHVFVRTKNWCPGDWQAPGRFQVKINNTTLATEFGTEPGWTWQNGGSLELPAGKTEIALHDLTGFDGRCDAIYFSKEPTPNLPTAAADLPGWKDSLSGRSQKTVAAEDFDVVIVGGGMAGCGAALAADSQGLKVALIQDRPLFGGNASQEIRVHTIGIHGKGGNILKQIDTKHYPNGDAKAIIDQKKREATLAASSVQCFANHLAIGLERDGKVIHSVDARESASGIIRRFRAPRFIDCTGDGWLGHWAGAEWRYGREAYSEFDEQWEKHADLWSPKVADNRVMGTSVLWNSSKAATPSTFPSVPWAMPVAKNSNDTRGDWNWEYSADDLNQIDDAEQIRDHMFRAIFGTFANAKKRPANALYKLDWVAYVGGRRESRRIIGDYIFAMQDAAQRRQFPDAVVEETRELDTHYQIAETGHESDFRSKALFYKTHGTYYIPFRSLYARDITNLMMAGRCFSCTHIGLSGPRVMNTCGQMGIATGYAAALCKKHAATPREVGASHITELRALIGYTT